MRRCGTPPFTRASKPCCTCCAITWSRCCGRARTSSTEAHTPTAACPAAAWQRPLRRSSGSSRRASWRASSSKAARRACRAAWAPAAARPAAATGSCARRRTRRCGVWGSWSCCVGPSAVQHGPAWSLALVLLTWPAPPSLTTLPPLPLPLACRSARRARTRCARCLRAPCRTCCSTAWTRCPAARARWWPSLGARRARWALPTSRASSATGSAARRAAAPSRCAPGVPGARARGGRALRCAVPSPLLAHVPRAPLRRGSPPALSPRPPGVRSHLRAAPPAGAVLPLRPLPAAPLRRAPGAAHLVRALAAGAPRGRGARPAGVLGLGGLRLRERAHVGWGGGGGRRRGARGRRRRRRRGRRHRGRRQRQQQRQRQRQLLQLRQQQRLRLELGVGRRRRPQAHPLWVHARLERGLRLSCAQAAAPAWRAQGGAGALRRARGCVGMGEGGRAGGTAAPGCCGSCRAACRTCLRCCATLPPRLLPPRPAAAQARRPWASLCRTTTARSAAAAARPTASARWATRRLACLARPRPACRPRCTPLAAPRLAACTWGWPAAGPEGASQPPGQARPGVAIQQHRSRAAAADWSAPSRPSHSTH